MDHLLRVTLIGLISGIVGTGTGGLVAFFITSVSNRILSVILEFSAGLMTAVVCFELLPEAFIQGGTAVTFGGILFGILIIIFIENYFIGLKYLKKGRRRNSILRAGILTAIGIAMHNFPEGFAVGSGFEASMGLGLTLTTVIVIHDIPEGIAMAVPMRVGGLSKIKAFGFTVLSGVPMGFGALLGSMLGGISSKMIAACLGFAGGAMLYIVFAELIPEAKKLYTGRLPSIGNVLGILCGIIVTIYN